MYKIELNDKELELIIESLATSYCVMNKDTEESNRNKIISIDNLIEKLKQVKESDTDKEGPTLTMTLKLDTTEFEEDLKRLGHKLLSISEI